VKWGTGGNSHAVGSDPDSGCVIGDAEVYSYYVVG